MRDDRIGRSVASRATSLLARGRMHAALARGAPLRITLRPVWAAVLAGLTVGAALLAGAGPASGLSDFTWSGAATATPAWSSATNWGGGTAPSGTVGTLTFPVSACSSSHCFAFDDIAGLVASNLNIVSTGFTPATSGPPPTSGPGWGILDTPSFGKSSPPIALTLTSGLSSTFASTGSGSLGSGAEIAIPITLGGPNTWTIGTNTNVAGDVSGTSESLTIDQLSADATLFLGGASNEVGPVTIIGQSSVPGAVFLGSPATATPGDLNGADKNSVTLTGPVTFVAAGSVGPLSAMSNSELEPGYGSVRPGILAVQGPLTLASTATVLFTNLAPGSGSPVAGTDYPNITSTGPVTLGGANLNVAADCNQAVGTTYTLVSAGAGVSGTFAGAANGAIVQAERASDSSCSAAAAGSPDLQINYTANTVTATVVPTPPKRRPPAPVTPVLGQTFAAHVISGVVLVRRPGAPGFTRLTGSQTVPFGSTVDTTQGRVGVTTAAVGHGTHTGVFYKGQFNTAQALGGMTTLTLTGGGTCASSAAKSGASGRRPRVRQLWGEAHGSYTTTGRYASASVLGTRWLVADRCYGTLVRVVSGEVRVTDLLRHRTVVLHAPGTYIARR